MNKIKIRILDEILSKHLQEIKAGHDGKLAQAIESLIKKSQLQLLKEVEECVPKKKDIRVQETYNGRDFKKGEQDKEIGFNDCRTQIIKSIKELGEEL